MSLEINEKTPNSPTASDVQPAPLPWNWVSVAANASDGCHLYLVDANGRKIAAIWGRAGEKTHTAQLIVDSVNGKAPA